MKHLGWLLLIALAGSASLAAQSPAETQQAPAVSEHPAASHEHGAPDELVMDGKVVGRRVPQKGGEICALCNQPIGASDPVYLVHGQRVPLHAAELAEPGVTARLETLLAQLRPRGAFLGAESAPAELSAGWFFFGIYVLIGLLFGALCAHRALNTGYNPISWFFVGLVLSLLGYLALLTRPKREVVAPAGIPSGLRKIAATYAPAACPKCGTENHPSAAQCLGCGAKLSPQLTSEVSRARLRAS